jgi:hypothetical protein
MSGVVGIYDDSFSGIFHGYIIDYFWGKVKGILVGEKEFQIAV